MAEKLYSGLRQLALLCVLCLTLFPQLANADHSGMPAADMTVAHDHPAMDHSGDMTHHHGGSMDSSLCSSMLCSGTAAGATTPIVVIYHVMRSMFMSSDVAQYNEIEPAQIGKPPKTA